MATHKAIDRICCVVLAAVLLLTAFLFGIAGKLSGQNTSIAMAYENKLFDTSKVHTIDIVMEDWEAFLENCRSEEYDSCTVVIDNDVYKNVAIRAKGNTSLTQVASYGNDRYSFKIEFDHYDSANTYYGLDKLCLNNIIQDNTYMKDYLTYQLMADMGVASPLCSYAYITVNGEDWGLYLAVEAVEEAFLQRNYGTNYGELYKPDSQSMGGGNPADKEWMFGQLPNSHEMEELMDGELFDGQLPEFDWSGDGEKKKPELSQGEEGEEGNRKPNLEESEEGNQKSKLNEGEEESRKPELEKGEEGNRKPELREGQEVALQKPKAGQKDGQDGQKPDVMGGRMNGSDDVLLKYIDEEYDSYLNIFDNAKTDITDSDKTRLIASLKKLSAGEDLENTVDVETVIRYFVVHNFVLNFDSYTGSMIHNYYLYEKDGQLQMIPWDYNLAFGGFSSEGGATNLVNYPIDSPVSGGDASDRPMLAWIFDSEEYTTLYHQIFAEFISEYFDSGYFSEMMDNVTAMLAPYVEKDPTKFCTYEEFEIGVSTLREFCLLRAESITGQLNGTIGTTSETQQGTALIDAGTIQISDMGSMQQSMGGGMEEPGRGMEKPDRNMVPQKSDIENSDSNMEKPLDEIENTSGNIEKSSDNLKNLEGGIRTPQNSMEKPTNEAVSDGREEPKQMAAFGIELGISVGILAFGLVFAAIYKRRR